jgi:hypothetical protein
MPVDFDQNEYVYKLALEQINTVAYWIQDIFYSGHGDFLDEELLAVLLPNAIEFWKEMKNNGL